MVLADTSVWVDHFRYGDGELIQMLHDGLVAIHPFVVGELACGSLARRDETLYLLAMLPQVPVASQREVLALLAQQRLYGKGIGWVDAHLLAAALIGSYQLWTRDRRLLAAAQQLSQKPFARA